MITQSFDPHSQPVFGPEDIYTRQNKLADICIITFSKAVIEHALSHFDCKISAVINTLAGENPIYTMHYKQRVIAFYMSPITAAGCATSMEDAILLTGARHYILFGSCGALDSTLTEGKLIVPTHAYRDEGLSYHYQEARDYINVKNAAQVAAILGELKIPYVKGRTWTTDALYRETRSNVAKRKADGCIAVDMECSGIQALCDFKELQYYTFFYTGDLLDAPVWDQRILLGELERDHQLRNFVVALEIAVKLDLNSD
ncbi:MAG: nucleoside phosphorylase [Clostridiales bacterium]|nr:nucleoside phosphorylase [Clostridiales bacterium]